MALPQVACITICAFVLACQAASLKKPRESNEQELLDDTHNPFDYTKDEPLDVTDESGLQIDYLEDFYKDQPHLVVDSSWPEDEKDESNGFSKPVQLVGVVELVNLFNSLTLPMNPYDLITVVYNNPFNFFKNPFFFPNPKHDMNESRGPPEAELNLLYLATQMDKYPK